MAESEDRRNRDNSVFIGNLDDKMTEDILWELFTQVGPVVSCHIPRDKQTGEALNFGFVDFTNEVDAEYATKVLNMVKVFDRTIKVNKAGERKQLDVGAKIFIGNLAPEVDEKMLYDTFSAFGSIIGSPKVVAGEDNGMGGEARGYAFITFESFNASDLAIECMNQQYFCNRVVQVSYAIKKDSNGERHGSEAERYMAAQQTPKFQPHTMFSGGMGETLTTTSRQQPMMAPPQQAYGMEAYPNYAEPNYDYSQAPLMGYSAGYSDPYAQPQGMQYGDPNAMQHMVGGIPPPPPP